MQRFLPSSTGFVGWHMAYSVVDPGMNISWPKSSSALSMTSEAEKEVEKAEKRKRVLKLNSDISMHDTLSPARLSDLNVNEDLTQQQIE